MPTVYIQTLSLLILASARHMADTQQELVGQISTVISTSQMRKLRSREMK